jgi:excisionase family DNA binding protein
MRPRQSADTAYRDWLMSLISVEEAAKLRGVSAETIRREIARGALLAIDLSRRRKGIRRYEALKLPPPA